MSEKSAPANVFIILEPISETFQAALEIVKKERGTGDLQIISAKDPAEATQLIRHYSPCLVGVSIQNPTQIVPTISFIKGISDKIDSNEIKVLAVNKISMDKLTKALEQLKLAVVATEPIPTRTLMFKFMLQIKALDMIRKQIDFKLKQNEKIAFKAKDTNELHGEVVRLGESKKSASKENFVINQQKEEIKRSDQVVGEVDSPRSIWQKTATEKIIGNELKLDSTALLKEKGAFRSKENEKEIQLTPLSDSTSKEKVYGEKNISDQSPTRQSSAESNLKGEEISLVSEAEVRAKKNTNGVQQQVAAQLRAEVRGRVELKEKGEGGQTSPENSRCGEVKSVGEERAEQAANALKGYSAPTGRRIGLGSNRVKEGETKSTEEKQDTDSNPANTAAALEIDASSAAKKNTRSQVEKSLVASLAKRGDGAPEGAQNKSANAVAVNAVGASEVSGVTKCENANQPKAVNASLDKAEADRKNSETKQKSRNKDKFGKIRQLLSTQKSKNANDSSVEEEGSNSNDRNVSSVENQSESSRDYSPVEESKMDTQDSASSVKNREKVLQRLKIQALKSQKPANLSNANDIESSIAEKKLSEKNIGLDACEGERKRERKSEDLDRLVSERKTKNTKLRNENLSGFGSLFEDTASDTRENTHSDVNDISTQKRSNKLNNLIGEVEEASVDWSAKNFENKKRCAAPESESSEVRKLKSEITPMDGEWIKVASLQFYFCSDLEKKGVNSFEEALPVCIYFSESKPRSDGKYWVFENPDVRIIESVLDLPEPIARFLAKFLPSAGGVENDLRKKCPSKEGATSDLAEVLVKQRERKDSESATENVGADSKSENKVNNSEDLKNTSKKESAGNNSAKKKVASTSLQGILDRLKGKNLAISANSVSALEEQKENNVEEESIEENKSGLEVGARAIRDLASPVVNNVDENEGNSSSSASITKDTRVDCEDGVGRNDKTRRDDAASGTGIADQNRIKKTKKSLLDLAAFAERLKQRQSSKNGGDEIDSAKKGCEEKKKSEEANGAGRAEAAKDPKVIESEMHDSLLRPLPENSDPNSKKIIDSNPEKTPLELRGKKGVVSRAHEANPTPLEPEKLTETCANQDRGNPKPLIGKPMQLTKDEVSRAAMIPDVRKLCELEDQNNNEQHINADAQHGTGAFGSQLFSKEFEEQLSRAENALPSMEHLNQALSLVGQSKLEELSKEEAFTKNIEVESLSRPRTRVEEIAMGLGCNATSENVRSSKRSRGEEIALKLAMVNAAKSQAKVLQTVRALAKHIQEFLPDLHVTVVVVQPGGLIKALSGISIFENLSQALNCPASVWTTFKTVPDEENKIGLIVHHRSRQRVLTVDEKAKLTNVYELGKDIISAA